MQVFFSYNRPNIDMRYFVTVDEVKAFYKTSYNFRKQTGMAHTNFYLWAKQGFVPIHAQRKIEEFTDGLLRASLLDCP